MEFKAAEILDKNSFTDNNRNTTPKGNKMNYEFLFTMWECIGCRLLYNDEQDRCTNCKNKCEPIKIKGVRA